MVHTTKCMARLSTFILQLLEQRYLIERYPISKSSYCYDRSLLDERTVSVCHQAESNEYFLPELPLVRYEAIFRVSPETMHLLVESIEHEVFHNNGCNSQRSVSLQTMVSVRRLCCESSSASNLSNIAQMLSISELAAARRLHRMTLVG
jgi:hypothetical protein